MAIRIDDEIKDAVEQLQATFGWSADQLIAWCDDPDPRVVGPDMIPDVNFWYGYLRGQADAHHTTAADLARAALVPRPRRRR